MTEVEALEAIAAQLSNIGGHLAGIRAVLETGQQAASALQAQAEQVLADQAAAVGDYLAQLPEDPPVDYSPFSAVPPGTQVRDLPGGGRLFVLPDGSLLRLGADDSTVFAGLDGTVEPIPITGPELTLPGGMTCTVRTERLLVTHEAAGISGLPLSVQPALVAPGRYVAELPGGERLIVSPEEGLATLINPAGTVLILKPLEVIGIGELVDLHPLAAGDDVIFAAEDSRHQGVLRADGSIKLLLASGLDLVLTFPASSDSSDGSGKGDPQPVPCEICGLIHDDLVGHVE